jgi:hypothetical protein
MRRDGKEQLMLLVEFVFALTASTLCAALLLPIAGRLRSRHGEELPPTVLFFLLLVILLGTWAGGIWLVPIGPRLWGASWLGFLIVGLLVSLLVATAVVPPSAARALPSSRRAPPLPAMSVFALVLILLLMLAVVIGYARTTPRRASDEPIAPLEESGTRLREPARSSGI